MSNKTLYVKPEDIATWDQARKLIQRQEGISLSEHLTIHLREIVEKYKSLPLDESKDAKTLIHAAKAFLKRQSFDTHEALQDAIDLMESNP